MDKDKDTSYTAMDDLTPKRSGRPPETKGWSEEDDYTGADAPDDAPEPSAPEEPLDESPINQDSDA